MLLSVIVIGRNEEAGLARLFQSLEPLARHVALETIYVDSASTDRSVEVAAALFDRTVVLEQDPHLSASAGRFAGVEEASGEWVLFLDGDMILVPDIVPDLLAHMADRPGEGAIGNYIYVYEDGSERVLRPFVRSTGLAEFFGGAVLLPAAALAQESWDPRLFAYEEIELYARLRERGWHVRLIDKPFVLHYTERIPVPVLLKGLFIKEGSVLGKKFLGFGQMLAARRASRSVWPLVRWLPEPFVLWAALLSGVAAGCLGAPLLGGAVLLAGAGFVSVRKSPKYLVIYLAFLPQAVHGMRAYDRAWRPRVRSVHTSARDPIRA